jgi:hypothetical protein
MAEAIKIPPVGGKRVYAGALFLLVGMVVVQMVQELGLVSRFVTLGSSTTHNATAARPLASYIPAGAHVLRMGPDIGNLTRLSYWDKRSNSWCHLLWLFEQAASPDEGIRAQTLDQWAGHAFPFENNNVIDDILRDLNHTVSLNGTQPAAQPVHVVLSIMLGCQELFNFGGMGTGNWLSAIYGMRMAALVASRSGLVQVDFMLDCYDAVETQRELVVPWITGYFSSAWIHEPVPVDSKAAAVLDRNKTRISPWEELRQTIHSVSYIGDVCRRYEDTPITVMLPYIRYELRRMAAALVGTPTTAARHNNSFAHIQQHDDDYFYPPSTMLRLPSLYPFAPPSDHHQPLLSGVELDDVAIHFRCGDLMGSKHPSFGFMKFSSFANRIRNGRSNDTFSIGILTQPFEVVTVTDEAANVTFTTQHRGGDMRGAVVHLCWVTTTALSDYLQQRFPHARIAVRNGPREVIALAYTRLVWADQAFSPISSFSVFPTLATTGRGHVRYPDFRKSPNQWLLAYPLPENVYDITQNDGEGLHVVSTTNSSETQLELMQDPDRLMTYNVWDIRFKGQRPPDMSVEETLIQWFSS